MKNTHPDKGMDMRDNQKLRQDLARRQIEPGIPSVVQWTKHQTPKSDSWAEMADKVSKENLCIGYGFGYVTDQWSVAGRRFPIEVARKS